MAVGIYHMTRSGFLLLTKVAWPLTLATYVKALSLSVALRGPLQPS